VAELPLYEPCTWPCACCGLSALDVWEKREIEVLRKGREHELPREHPAVMKRRGAVWVA